MTKCHNGPAFYAKNLHSAPYGSWLDVSFIFVHTVKWLQNTTGQRLFKPALPCCYICLFLYSQFISAQKNFPPSLWRAGSFLSYFVLSRNRKVTICARVQSSFGLNVVSEVPTVMSLSTAHWTAGA